MRHDADAAYEALEFAPDVLRAQEAPPSPLPRAVLHYLLALCAIMLVWAAVGRLDIVAVAPGKLVPQTFLKVVQPADSGIVREILVNEGEAVAEGQVLMRMDANLSEADRRILEDDLRLKSLALRRIDAELGAAPLARQPGDPQQMYAQVEAQYRARRQAYLDAIGSERAVLAKARHDLKSAVEIEAKLRQTAPIYQEQEKAWDQLAKEGFAGRLLALERQKSRIENEQDLRAQGYTVQSLKETIEQSEKRIAQIESGYRQQLHNERVETEAQRRKTEQELAKQLHRHALLELRAPQAGRVKDLATHTPGTVVQPGTVLLTIVPHDEPLRAEVWVANLDSGFVRAGQTAKLKLAAFPFQQYGMLGGVVRHVSADASDKSDNGDRTQPAAPPLYYRALIELDTAELIAQGRRFALAPGMQLNAEINLGTRTVLEYLFSPLRKTVHEAWRER